MNLKDKKEQILRLIKLGMELYRAELVLGCSEEEIKKIEEDLNFNQRVKEHEAISEKELLDKLEDAIDFGVDKGKSSAIQWKLERINAKRWGSKEMDNKYIPNVSIELVGRKPNDKDS